MNDKTKTKEQLLREVKSLRNRVRELEKNDTAKKQNEKVLWESEDKHRILLNSLTAPILALSKDQEILFCNISYEELVGKKSQELIGKKLLDVFPAFESTKSYAGYLEVMKTGRMQKVEGKMGDRYWLSRIYPTPWGILAIAVDTTESKQTAQALRESEEKWRSLIENAPNIIAIIDAKGRIQFSNVKVMATNGKNPVGYTIYEYIQPEYHATVKNTINKVFKMGESGKYEIESVNPYGQLSWYEINAGPVISDGKVTAAILISTDITVRKKVEEALMESEEKFRNLAEQSPNMIFIYQKDRVVYANRKCEEVMGYTKEEFYSPEFDFLSLIAPESLPLIKANLAEHMESKEIAPYEYSLVKKNGERLEGILTTKLIKFSGKMSILGTVTDITERKRAEEAHKASEQFLQNLFDAIQDGISVLDTDLNVIRTNYLMEKMYADQMPLIGKKCYVVYQQRKSQCPRCPTIETIKTGKTHTQIVPYPSENDPVGWIELSTFPIIDGGNVTGVIEYVKDITERKRAEDALREREEMIRDLVDTCQDWIWSTDIHGRHTYCNPAVEQILGYTANELMGKVSLDFMNEDDRKKINAKLQRWKAGKVGWSNLLNRWKHKDGSVRYLESTAVPILGDNGDLIGYRGVDRDITERRQAEGALREREEMVRALVETSRDWIWSIDLDGRHTYCNPAIEKILGYTADELTGKVSFDFMHEEDRKQVETKLSQWKADKRGWNSLLIRWRHKNGKVRYLESNAVPILGTEGELVGFRGVDRDITERILTEETLRFTQFAVDKFADTAFWMGSDAKFIYANEVACRSLEYSREELLSMTVHDIDPNFPQEVWGNHWNEIKERGSFTFESHHKTKNGRIFPVEITVNFVEFEGKEYSCAFVRDISERKQTEEALRESEAQFRDLTELLPEIIFEADQNGNLTFANRVAFERFGYTQEDFERGINIEDTLIPKDRKRAMKTARRVMQGEVIGINEYKAIRKDGSTFDIAIHSTPIIRDGEPAGLRGLIIDVTERKQAEEERRNLEAQIQHAQKLESLGVLAGGIAHDFNNLLTGILGNAELALLELSPTSPVRDTINEIVTTTVRAAELSKQMLAYSGKGKFVVKRIDLSNVVDEMTHLIKVSISKIVVMRFNLAKDLPAIEADVTQVRQVIMNLIINASEAIGERSGVISLSTGVMECDRDFLSSASFDKELKEGDYVFLEVSDTGCGMEKDTLDKIYDPFFTTKFTGRGLGLAAVLGIIRGHKGAIKVESEVGKGTTFKILFPASRTKADEEEDQDELMKEMAGTGCILVVDDEETVRAVTKRTLQRFGYTVILAEDGREAVEIFEKQSDRFELILLDMAMPHMNGEEAYREIRRINKKARVILCSGYNERDATSRFAGKGLVGFLQKPYGPKVLISKVNEVLKKSKK